MGQIHDMFLEVGGRVFHQNDQNQINLKQTLILDACLKAIEPVSNIHYYLFMAHIQRVVDNDLETYLIFKNECHC